MSENNKVDAAVKTAAATLQNAFAQTTSIEGRDEFRYIQEEYLVSLYLSELDKKNVYSFLSDVSASISKMRSSYLPIDIVRELSSFLSEMNSEVVTNNVALKESYENTFMRMLGLPRSSALENEVLITAISSDGNLISLPYEEIERQILNERQVPRRDRRVHISSNVYNMDNLKYENENLNYTDVEVEDNLDGSVNISETELQNELAGPASPNLANIETEFYKFSYLLIPPVQDARISGCINEPTKIVSPNFSNKRSRNINSNTIKSSMLESIIRIRMDRLSGYSKPSVIQDENDEDMLVLADNYGVLESLFIIRIRSALKALAKRVSGDIDFLREMYEQTGLIPIENSSAQESAIDHRISEQDEETENGSGEVAELGFSDLEKQRVIEDSMMALLDDNSDALDLQVNTQRNSSIKDSHIMSSLIGIIDLPRRRIASDIKENFNKKIDKVSGPGAKRKESIDIILGVSKGIGVVDILAFILALFTMPEQHLVRLLSDLEYEKFLKEFAGSNEFSQEILAPSGISTANAIETLTQYIVSAYNLFNEDLKSDDSGLGN